MTERYLDGITLRVTGHVGHAAPAAGLVKGWEISIPVGGGIDTEELLRELEVILGTEPFVMRESRTFFSWGADAVWMDIAIALSSGATVTIADRLIGAVRKRREEGEGPQGQATAEEVARSAREFLAEARSLPANGILIEGVEPLPSGGSRIVLRVHGELYRIEAEADGTLFRMERDLSDEMPPNQEELDASVEVEDEDEGPGDSP